LERENGILTYDEKVNGAKRSRAVAAYVMHFVSSYRISYRVYQENGFPGHPADRHERRGAELGGGVVVRVAGARHAGVAADVRDLDAVLVADDARPRRQVAVNDAQRLEVLHRRRDLRRHVDERTVAVPQQHAVYSPVRCPRVRT